MLEKSSLTLQSCKLSRNTLCLVHLTHMTVLISTAFCCIGLALCVLPDGDICALCMLMVKLFCPERGNFMDNVTKPV
jgi:hypothetical protein